MFYLTHFDVLRPPYESAQEDTLDWLVEAHTEAERKSLVAVTVPDTTTEHLSAFRESLRERLWRVGCKPDRIARRGHIVEDYLHRNWDQMEIPFATLATRMQHFDKYADLVFAKFYESETAPDDLIHTTCTGYLAPSGAQKLISHKNWTDTTITHAYHMGCYAAIPSIRLAKGFLSSDPTKKRVDVVHTEMCTLHVNPALHRLDALVSQSLFADGFIKYSMTSEKTTSGFQVLAHREEIIPTSIKAMTWNLADWGFEMSLAKEVPVLIARSLPRFVAELGGDKTALFAVHPGGPKILTNIQDILALSSEQLRYSADILLRYGNMSSATLPHIWKAILEDPSVPTGTPVVSLAFGPGLTLCGLCMVKQ
jgi:predicted naringenin-chalcone synthase